ncbi:hypothetical protein CLOACE_07240 [Clostridium acetireducens DSM 10703]|uniref:Uncharacterized protein n=1 Tax=Clostridium acetireducens DSM 10703 TaxID=1121290 RepID=A0A1E8F0I0_9CLOT|nr:hypothetical protein CLOACE_07240 [Clostridium acetireducens DSM 10703]
MSEYFLNINGRLELSDYSSIYDYIDIVDKTDKLTINIDCNNKDFDIIYVMLKNKKLSIDYKKVKGEKYSIIAYK